MPAAPTIRPTTLAEAPWDTRYSGKNGIATYHLPEKPLLPQRNVFADSLLSIGAALVVGVGAIVAFRERGGKGDGDA